MKRRDVRGRDYAFRQNTTQRRLKINLFHALRGQVGKNQLQSLFNTDHLHCFHHEEIRGQSPFFALERPLGEILRAKKGDCPRISTFVADLPEELPAPVHVLLRLYPFGRKTVHDPHDPPALFGLSDNDLQRIRSGAVNLAHLLTGL